MASITIRNLEDDVKTRLRRRAAGNGRSMEEEARVILAEAVDREAAPERGLGTAIHELFRPFGGVELDLPPRAACRMVVLDASVVSELMRSSPSGEVHR